MRGRTPLGLFSALFVGHALVGCANRTDETGPLPSNEIIKSKNTAAAPFASGKVAAATPAPTVSAAASGSTPVPTVSAATSSSAAPPIDTPPDVAFDESGVATGAGARKTTKLVMKVPTAKVEGSTSPDAITRVLRQSAPALRKCYEDAKKDNAKLGGGTVNVEFTIDGKGAVKTPKESGSTLKDTKVASCVTGEIGKLTFAAAADGKDVKVTETLSFDPMKTTINGKAIGDATVDDVKAALKDAGFTDIVVTPPKEGKSPVVITAKKGDKKVSITFAPAKLGEKDKPLDDAAKTKLVADGVVVDDGLFLAIVIENDKKAADELLASLLKVEAEGAAGK